MHEPNPLSEKDSTTEAQLPDPDDVFVVGLGASAGGIQALKEFFEYVPTDSGIAYVVILHLSPDHDSKLASVLQGVTALPVLQVTEKVRVAPNHIYVVPPNQHLEMLDGDIVVSPNTLMEERRAPVAIFFRTLAESHGPRAVAVVLSGTGANGSMGLKRIKERGGAAFVQNPREAEFSEMPRNSIATDLVDDVLPVSQIPARIIAYKNGTGAVEIPIEAEARPEDQQQALREVFTQLRVRTGHDFSNYKRPTLLRRIERRINIRNLPNLPAYAVFMRENPEETQALLKDLLISVTNFFRDHRAFETLERDILPRIFEGKKGGDQIRIWAVGCATGEEAYSLAMLCAERTTGAIDAPKVQIFATDIDEAAIAAAREGVYTINDAADVSPERLRRFFIKEGDEYRIRREIREMVLFANHNVIKDPPFSRLDLATCRNMLIYLNHTAQERVMETLHFALKPGGFLFLGGSESVDGASDLFASVSREHHIFQSRQASTRPFPVPESVPAFRFEPQRTLEAAQVREQRALERITYGDLHQQLLEQYAPPSVLVNEEYDIVHLSERAGRYLQISGGEPSQNLLKLIRQELRLELRSALYQAVQRHSNVEARNLKVRIEDHTETLNIHVRPVLRTGDTARGFILVLFEQVDDTPHDEEIVLTSDEPVARQLEEELMRLKAQLRASIEQHELQSEELKASNEELQAMNEELRSAAEELETSKEELQSINEELATVNQELKVKVEEVTITSNNLQNLINSTDIATIFLDRSFRVNLFSPATRSLFNLIPADFGRPLSDITHRLAYDDLLQDAETVLDKLHTIEREVPSTDGRVFLMRMLPYRTADDRIQGVVVTFLDVTARKRADEYLRESEEKLSNFVNATSEAIYEMSADWHEMHFLQGKEFIATTEKPRSDWLEVYIPAAEKTRVKEAINRAIETRRNFELEHRVIRLDGTEGWTFSRAIPLLDEAGNILKWFGAASDITMRKQAEAAFERARRYAEATLRTSPVPLLVLERDLRIVTANEAFYECFQVKPEQTEGQLVYELGHGQWNIPKLRELLEDILPHRSTFYDFEMTQEFEGLGQRTLLLNARRMEVEEGGPERIVLVIEDITRRKRAEAALHESEARLRLMLDNVTDYAIFITDDAGRIERWNAGAEQLFGWSGAEVLGQTCDIVFTPEDRAAGAPEAERQQARLYGRATDERWHIRKDGTRFYVSGVMSALHDGELSGFVKIARDLTERKKTEEALRRSREELEQAVQARTQELSGAHDSLTREVQERRAVEERVKELLRQVIDTQENERRNLSRELHDSLGQLLTALRMGVETLSKLTGEAAREQLTDLQETLGRLDSEVDFLAWELRPASLDEFGLAAALTVYVEEWSKQFSIPADFHANQAERERLPYEIETTLYRICQEALNNIAKHAQATHVAVILEHRDGHSVLIVEDNGKGFGLEKDALPETTKKGLGLLNIQERAALVGGTVEIESSPGTGTTIFVRIPLPPPRPERKGDE